MVDLTPFCPASLFTTDYVNDLGIVSNEDPRDAYTDYLREHGFTPPQSLILGSIQRIADPNDKRGKKTGWSFYQEFSDNDQRPIGIGVFGSWRGEPEKITFVSRSQKSMSVSEQAALNARVEAARIAREREQSIIWTETAKECATLFSEAVNADKGHAYLTKKGVLPFGIKQSENDLLIPVIIDDAIASVQFIKLDGTKMFKRGGKTKGGHFKIDGDERTVLIAEGYATGASLHMATGYTTYVAFNAGNLYEVASFVKRKHDKSRIVICGDDDIGSNGNVGRAKAEQAAEALNLEVLFPNMDGQKADFNDLHKAKGLDAIKNLFLHDDKKAYAKPKKETDVTKTEPPTGFMRDVYDYYNATSGIDQYGFACQTAIAIASIVLGRSYKTNKNNFSSLYLLNVGKSSTGKEHLKTVCEQILEACGLASLIAGDGYTSSGAVFSALMRAPKHLSIIDEFGRYLEASASTKFGNFNQREANTKLMEAIGRAHSVMRPPNYSTMTLKKADAEKLDNRVVHNPAITLVAMTTPSTLFKTLDMGSIKDGFINRFIISISTAERSIRKHKDPIDVPESIKAWTTAIINRAKINHNAAESPQFITLSFETKAIEAQEDFQRYCIDTANMLDSYGMAELTGRANEMAMRLALIVALSSDPNATEILEEHMLWSIAYVKKAMDETISRLKMTISASSFESHKKETLQALRDMSPSWIKFSAMNKTTPFAQHPRKYLQEILDALVDAELIDVRQAETSARGRPTKEYRACE